VDEIAHLPVLLPHYANHHVVLFIVAKLVSWSLLKANFFGLLSKAPLQEHRSLAIEGSPQTAILNDKGSSLYLVDISLSLG
jgi:hypothetical protein